MATTVWQCKNCGSQYKTTSTSVPSPKQNGSCKSNSSGNHVWEKIG